MKNVWPMCVCAGFALTAPRVAEAEEVPSIGRDASGLPGIARVGVPIHDSRTLALSGTAGYGYTEGVVDGDSAHHRGIGRLGFGATPVEWLQLALRVDGRYDQHPDDDEGSDDGLVGDPWLVVRSGTRVSQNWALGGELGVWFPGSDAPSVELAATTVEGKLLAALLPQASNLNLASMLGFRLDRSAESVSDLGSLRRGDRIALGASDFNAVLFGLGMSYRLGATEVLGELSADVLLGAPSFSQSPLRASAGVRHHINAFQLEGLLGASLSSRPELGPDVELVPIEPRVTATLALKYVFDLAPKPKLAPAPKIPTEPPPPEPVEPKPVNAPVTGIVTDAAGNTLAQVNITLTSAGSTFTTVTDDAGRYQLDAIPFGAATVRAETADYAPGELQTSIGGDGSRVELGEMKLALASLHAQVQGLVRTFSGEPLQAKVHVAPPGTEHTCTPDGRFAIDVEPGTYTVTISAEGYESQKRTVRVPDKGVIIFNADLRKQRE